MKIIYWIAGTGFLLSAMAIDSESMIPAWICAGCVALLIGAAVGRRIGEKMEKLHRCNRKEKHDRGDYIEHAKPVTGGGAGKAQQRRKEDLCD